MEQSTITLLGIFLEGLLSFFSPCVLPILPLYFSYLAGNNKQTDENGKTTYNTLAVFISTFCFVLGISLTFVILAASLNFFSKFVTTYANVISIIGGTVLIFFGLHEMGIINISVLNNELKPKVNLHLETMTNFKAFILGFVFSLGWSPCIGPMLANAILMAATNSQGYLYIVAYGLGLVIPFLVCGLLTSKVLDFINNKRNILNYVLKLAGIILICFGCYMIYDAAKEIVTVKEVQQETSTTNNESNDITSYLVEHEFYDQYGNVHKLSDYEGQYVMLDFITTWCTYCRMEIPYYHDFNETGNAECLYVMYIESSKEETLEFIEEQGITLPVLIDEEGILTYYLNVSSYPTKYILSPESKFITYCSGMITGIDNYNAFLDYAKQMNELESE